MFVPDVLESLSFAIKHFRTFLTEMLLLYLVEDFFLAQLRHLLEVSEP